jgi:hypothetical protein
MCIRDSVGSEMCIRDRCTGLQFLVVRFDGGSVAEAGGCEA